MSGFFMKIIESFKIKVSLQSIFLFKIVPLKNALFY